MGLIVHYYNLLPVHVVLLIPSVYLTFSSCILDLIQLPQPPTSPPLSLAYTLATFERLQLCFKSDTSTVPAENCLGVKVEPKHNTSCLMFFRLKERKRKSVHKINKGDRENGWRQILSIVPLSTLSVPGY